MTNNPFRSYYKTINNNFQNIQTLQFVTWSDLILFTK